MVRNIVGSLIVVGQHEQPPEWLAELLRQKDRTKAAATAKPGGLYLVEVTYPESYNIPQVPPGPLWLGD
jgi:tRNA pseudouridine38-40 synthase